MTSNLCSWGRSDGPPTKLRDRDLGKQKPWLWAWYLLCCCYHPMLKHLSLSEYRSHDCGLDRAAAQMEDLQSADSLGRRLRALIRAPCSTIHHPLYSFSPSSEDSVCTCWWWWSLRWWWCSWPLNIISISSHVPLHDYDGDVYGGGDIVGIICFAYHSEFSSQMTSCHCSLEFRFWRL